MNSLPCKVAVETRLQNYYIRNGRRWNYTSDNNDSRAVKILRYIGRKVANNRGRTVAVRLLASDEIEHLNFELRTNNRCRRRV